MLGCPAVTDRPRRGRRRSDRAGAFGGGRRSRRAWWPSPRRRSGWTARAGARSGSPPRRPGRSRPTPRSAWRASPSSRRRRSRTPRRGTACACWPTSRRRCERAATLVAERVAGRACSCAWSAHELPGCSARRAVSVERYAPDGTPEVIGCVRAPPPARKSGRGPRRRSLVEGAIWGRIAARRGRADRPTRRRGWRGFGELVATAISNREARDEVQTLLAEQAALRRVATLVAEGASASRLFSAVTDEVGDAARASRSSRSTASTAPQRRRCWQRRTPAGR